MAAALAYAQVKSWISCPGKIRLKICLQTKFYFQENRDKCAHSNWIKLNWKVSPGDQILMTLSNEASLYTEHFTLVNTSANLPPKNVFSFKRFTQTCQCFTSMYDNICATIVWVKSHLCGLVSLAVRFRQVSGWSTLMNKNNKLLGLYQHFFKPMISILWFWSNIYLLY